MSALTLRAEKGAPLTNAEVDANFQALNTDKMAKGQNLGDLADVSAARGNLGVPSTAEAAAIATNQAIAMAIALG